MASQTSTKSFKCPFKSCTAAFGSQDLLRLHKTNSPDHDYCSTCNEDYEDDDAFLLHKIQSPRHIACPICGEDFKSEGGQRHHVEQMHAAKQRLNCAGCGEFFDRAGGLMGHIEGNTCPKITYERFKTHRAQKELTKAFLSDPEGFRYPTGYAGRSGAAKARIAERSLLDDDDVAPLQGPILAPELSPTIKRGQPTTLDAEDPSNEFTGDVLSAFQETSSDDPGNREDLLGTGRPSRVPISPLSPAPLAPSAEGDKGGPAYEEASKQVGTARQEGAKQEAPDAWNPSSGSFKPQNFLHPITGKYSCPYPTCRATIKSLNGFKSHLTSPAHQSERLSCPSCLRVFKSTTALVQHCESPSNRCQIRHTLDYGDALNTLTGGFIGTKGYHPDGTVKYEAAEVQW